VTLKNCNMNTGIGNAAILKQHGIPVALELESVGENFREPGLFIYMTVRTDKGYQRFVF
jgi:hypothetical protein